MNFHPTPPTSGRYGAPMGRRSVVARNVAMRGVRLVRVRIDSGGYDAGGAYWGLGAPLYCAWLPGGEEDVLCTYLRAQHRDAAKAEVRRLCGDVPQRELEPGEHYTNRVFFAR